MGATIVKPKMLTSGAGCGHSGSPMSWEPPQFSHGVEPKALNLLQGGTLCHSLMGLIIGKAKKATYGPLCATDEQSYNWGANGSAVSYCIHHKRHAFITSNSTFQHRFRVSFDVSMGSFRRQF